MTDRHGQKHIEQNLIKDSKEELFNRILLISELKNEQVNPDLTERFSSSKKAVPYHLDTPSKINVMIIRCNNTGFCLNSSSDDSKYTYPDKDRRGNDILND